MIDEKHARPSWTESGSKVASKNARSRHIKTSSCISSTTKVFLFDSSFGMLCHLNLEDYHFIEPTRLAPKVVQIRLDESR